MTTQTMVSGINVGQQGDEVVILPAITNEEAATLFPQGYRELKPYLRMTKV